VLHHLWLEVLIVWFCHLLLLALVLWTLLVYPFASCLSWCYAWYFYTHFPSPRVWLVLAKLASPRAQKSWMPVMTLILFLPFQLCAFLAFSFPLLSHLSFLSVLVVCPHKSLLFPGRNLIHRIQARNQATLQIIIAICNHRIPLLSHCSAFAGSMLRRIWASGGCDCTGALCVTWRQASWLWK